MMDTPMDSHAVSDKTWPTTEQVRDRFTAARHEQYMRKAIAKSREAGVERRSGGAFGAIVVDRAGQVVGEGSNRVVSNFDPTWHAEIEAIRAACSRLKKVKLDGCVIYTSAGPCPMCFAAAYWAGIDGIVHAARAADVKKYGNFDDDFIYKELIKPAGARMVPEIELLRDEALAVWKEFAALPDNVSY